MADGEVEIEIGEGGAVGDVDMGETGAVDESGLQDIEAESQPRQTFLE